MNCYMDILNLPSKFEPIAEIEPLTWNWSVTFLYEPINYDTCHMILGGTKTQAYKGYYT